MDLFMRDCNSMVSNVTINKQAAINVGTNGQTFSTVYSASDMFTNGVPIIGTGARIFMRKASNYIVAPPYRKLTTTEPEDSEYTITINQIDGVTVESDLDAAFEADLITLTATITDSTITGINFSTDDFNVIINSTDVDNIYEFRMGSKNLIINITAVR